MSDDLIAELLAEAEMGLYVGGSLTVDLLRRAATALSEAADEIERLRIQLHTWSNELQRVACHDEGFTEEYGWPIGDHVAETLASSILEEHNRLRAIVSDLAVGGPWVHVVWANLVARAREAIGETA